MIRKCANPECSASFHYGEGRLFRFHRTHADAEPPPNTHSVQHFWLCGPCSQTYTLGYAGDCGVMIRLQFPRSGELMDFHVIAPA